MVGASVCLGLIPLLLWCGGRQLVRGGRRRRRGGRGRGREGERGGDRGGGGAQGGAQGQGQGPRQEAQQEGRLGRLVRRRRRVGWNRRNTNDAGGLGRDAQK